MGLLLPVPYVYVSIPSSVGRLLRSPSFLPRVPAFLAPIWHRLGVGGYCVTDTRACRVWWRQWTSVYLPSHTLFPQEKLKICNTLEARPMRRLVNSRRPSDEKSKRWGSLHQCTPNITKILQPFQGGRVGGDWGIWGWIGTVWAPSRHSRRVPSLVNPHDTAGPDGSVPVRVGRLDGKSRRESAAIPTCGHDP